MYEVKIFGNNEYTTFESLALDQEFIGTFNVFLGACLSVYHDYANLNISVSDNQDINSQIGEMLKRLADTESPYCLATPFNIHYKIVPGTIMICRSDQAMHAHFKMHSIDT